MVHVENESDFEAKMQAFKDVMRQWDNDSVDRTCLPSLAFDDSSSLLCYSSPIGVKMASVATGHVLRVYGKVEQGDFYLQIALF